MISHYFPTAPWPTCLKVTSTLASLILLGVSYAAYRAIPPYGFAHEFGSAVAWSLPAIAVGSLLFVVRGYDVDVSRLYVRRLLWSTVVPIDGVTEIVIDPAAARRSLRVFGNGGLFSFTGVYWNRTLGRFRLFGTDLACTVVLVLGDHTVVVTPRAPHVFAQHLVALFPRALPNTRPDG